MWSLRAVKQNAPAAALRARNPPLRGGAPAIQLDRSTLEGGALAGAATTQREAYIMRGSTVRADFLEVYASQLEREHGVCVMGRAALVVWLDGQLDRVARLRVPGAIALEMISAEYMLWQAEAVGLSPDDCQ